MRARKKDQKNLIKVGAFISALTVVLMVMIISIGKETSIFEPKLTVRARVPSVSNLKSGSYVELKGIHIGSVTGVRIVSEDEVEISMKINESEMKWIKQDSKVAISTAGLVGDKYVEVLTGSKEAAPLDPEKEFLVSDPGVDMQAIVSKGESIAAITERILSKLDNIMVKIGDGKVLVDTINYLNKSAGNMEKITSELKEARMGHMVQNVNMSMENLNKASTSLDRILKRIENGPGTANSLIYDESVHDDLRALLGGAQRNKVIKYFIRESIKKSKEREPQD